MPHQPTEATDRQKGMEPASHSALVARMLLHAQNDVYFQRIVKRLTLAATRQS